jgi:peptidyl-prolyl cis-trans isomerase SurA
MEDARKRLDSLRSRITKENTPFGDAVRLYSQDDETRSSGGMLMNEENATSRFTPEQLSPEIYFAIEKLKPGEYSEPQPYASRDGRQGYRILFLKSRSEAHLTNMKQDYPRIQATALGMKKLRKMEAWYATARQKTFVRVHPSYRDCENLGFVKK